MTRLRTRAWLGLAALGAVVVACIGPEAFGCTDSAQCRLDNAVGVCEPERYCSYPDDACDSNRRFERYAPGALAGACVDVDVVDGSTGRDGDSESETTTADDAAESETGNDPCVRFDAIAAGLLHTCARDTDGDLWCWGANIWGQLGSSAVDFQIEPTRVPGIGPVAAFDTSEHTCALQVDGDAFCWGRNDEGQVRWDGGGMRVESPIQVQDVPGTINNLSVGHATTCASVDDKLYCWGSLLDNPNIAPTEVPGVQQRLVAMSSGRAHSCGVSKDGVAGCWGEDLLGQLGDGGGQGNGEAVTVQFTGMGRVERIDAGNDHTCAVFADDTGQAGVRCWGDNTFGQTGLLIPSPVEFPHTPIGGLVGSQYPALAAGAKHACVWSVDDGLSCWGDNEKGQANWDTSVEFQDGPNAVALPFGETPAVVALAAGNVHTCALREDGTVDCWGCNMNGQLGDPDRQCTSGDALTTRVCAVNP